MRRRWIPLVVCGALFIGLAPGTAAGGPADPRPVVLSATWLTEPVRAHRGEVLQVAAADANDVLTEIDVVWGDGVITFANLICSGRTATVRLGHRFPHRGVFVVQVVAVSSDSCGGGGHQESLPYPVTTVVL